MFIRYLIVIICTAIVSSLFTYFVFFYTNKTTEEKITNNSETLIEIAERDETNIVIGFIGDLSGEASSYVLPALNATRIAIDEINDSGQLKDKKLVLVTEDSQCLYSEAKKLTKKLINEHNPAYIIGGLCSGETFGVIEIAGDREILIFTPASTSADLSGRGKYFFRNSPSDARTASLLAEVIREDGHQAVVTISEETEYAKTLARAFAEAQNINIISLGDEEIETKEPVKIIKDIPFLTGTLTFSQIAIEVQEINPDALFLNTQTRTSALRILKELRREGIRIPIYSTAILNDIPFSEDVGLYTKNLKIADNPDLNEENPTVQRLFAKYIEQHGKLEGISYYIGSAYDAIHILANGIEKYGTDVSKVAEYLKTIKYNGTIGEYEFEDFGDIRGITLEVKEFINGIPVPIQDN